MSYKTGIMPLLDRIVHKYVRWQNKKRTYGTEILLTQAEIHTLVAIGDNPDVNVTELGDYLGVTKGASSQMVYKLMDKGLVKKSVSPNSDAEVILSLTEKGKINYEGHAEIHRLSEEPAIKKLYEVEESIGEGVFDFLHGLEQMLDEQLTEK